MANVNFKRGDNATMNATDITDGLIFLNTEDRQIYFDNGTERLQYGGDTTLVSDTSSASDDTAFTSNATVNIFTQQDTIVDSKANALAVTQNHIPLGCLAFSETIGTEDFSSIGDGTVSGALVDLNSRLNVPSLELTTNGLTFNSVTYSTGGYAQYGNIVFFQIRGVTTSTSAKISGFPAPYDADIETTFYSNQGVCHITATGVLEPNSTWSGTGTFVVSGSYICTTD